jgi:peptidyl-tRNA hydrolase, PTH1 family
MVELVCALGNPGKEYRLSRHNLGWMLIDRWRDDLDWTKKFKGEYAVIHRPRRLIVLKPLTFMNKSGESLRACMDFFSLKLDQILVIHDDLELDFGRSALKAGGGLGGHNGLKSIREHTGSADFLRLRLGIGRPRHGGVSQHVLSRFSREEEAELPLMLETGLDLLEEGLGFTRP